MVESTDRELRAAAEDGQALIEYAPLLVLIAIACFGALILLRDEIGALYEHIDMMIRSL